MQVQKQNIKYELHKIVMKHINAGRIQQTTAKHDTGGGIQNREIRVATHAPNVMQIKVMHVIVDHTMQYINIQWIPIQDKIKRQHISRQITNIQQSIGQIMHAQTMHAVIHDTGRSKYRHSSMINGGHRQ